MSGSETQNYKKVAIFVSCVSPFLFFLIFVIALIIDQEFYPTNEVNPIFANEENASLALNKKGTLLFDATFN